MENFNLINILSALVIILVLNTQNSVNVYNAILNLVIILIIFFFFVIELKFDFIAQALLTIYAGAILILFLLVMMMFDAPTNVGKVSFFRNSNKMFLSYVACLITALFILFYHVSYIFLIKIHMTKNNILNSSSIATVSEPMLNFLKNTNIINIGNHMFQFFHIELALFGLLLSVIIMGVNIYFNNISDISTKSIK